MISCSGVRVSQVFRGVCNVSHDRPNLFITSFTGVYLSTGAGGLVIWASAYCAGGHGLDFRAG